RLAFLTLVGLTLAAYIAFTAVAAMHTHDRIGLGGSPLFYDFSVFHQAGVLANRGHAADAYDDARMIASEQAAFPGNTLRLPWNYPPTFQMMLMPLGALPYVAAWLVWSGLLYGFYALLARRLVDDADGFLFLLLAPGAAVNLFFGQNGILSTVLLGGGVLLLRTRPVLGGMLLGLMAYKPQLALLIPFALMAGRQWRALTAAILSQLALMLLSLWVLGAEPWFAFFYKLAHPAAVFSSSSSDWRSVPSMMIFARTLGLGTLAGNILHWSVAAIAAAGTLWTWRKTEDGVIRAAVLATAILLVTPYLRAYDLALLILPIAMLLRSQPGLAEKAIIFAAWLLPAVLMFSAPAIQYGPLVSLALLIMVFWRTFAERPSMEGVG
ncbi:MAG TPA: glycosyltransferase family 87 protein, partial [Rhizomicrobium sp.]|nr:glycosyltransferase family 87 protein [Rhizomicrobium sp.]